MPARRSAAVLIDVLFALVAVTLGAWSFWPVYQSPEFVLMLAVTLLAGAAVAAVGWAFRLPSIAVAGLIATVYLGLGVQLAVPSEATAGGLLPTGAGFVDLVQGTWLSWKQLVTISIPVGSYQALLVPAFLLTLVATVLTVTIALRSSRPELATLPPALLFVAGIVLGSSVSSLPLPLLFALFVVLLSWLIRFRLQRRAASIRSLREQSGLLVESRRERRSTALLTTAGATVMLITAAAAGIAAAAFIPPAGARQVARTAVEQPFDPREYPSPLSGFRSYFEPEHADQAMLTVTGLPADRRLRIATLDTYDGVTYAVGSGDETSASGSFTRVPYRIDQGATKGKRTTTSVVVRDYRGPWLPGSGQLEQVRFSGEDAQRLAGAFFYNDVTGTGAVTTALRSGDTYTEETVVKPQLTADQLEKVEPGTDSVPRPRVIPDELASVLQKYTAGVDGAGAKLAAALRGLAQDGYISHGVGPKEPASRSGHGADRITELLTDVPMLGDQEQYAVTAALMARQLGFPARVVVGFVAPKDAAGSNLTFVGSDISAWIEVQTTSGWVTVDPTPPLRPVPPKQPDQPTQISRPQTNVQPPVDENPQRNDEPPQAQVDPSNQPQPNPVLETLLAVLIVVGWTLLILALVASPFLAVLAAKWRRRAIRRSAPTARERIVGGWREFADAAVDHGYDPPPAATRVEFADTIGGSRANALAKVADRATFSGIAPTPAEAETVWKAVDELRSQLAKRDTRWKRLLAAVSLRSLGYRGRRNGKGRER
ncbi:transglutaminase-like domain-containing protein [Cryocola sp. 340MFSha3.1]|uniref:transglutaminase-like domain-containing protein n=1 Tax=Cryocola sp. 340MFSha3.1 TaxID=1169145 RepID=UPI00035D61B1|nr:transglutaminase-like domain-containing protein [Cryocola sp. 340MFSha3.1]